LPCASLGIARRQLLGLPAASFGIEHRPPFADWGTAAQERFAPLSTPYFRSADGVVLAFDLTSRASFERVPSYWTDEIYYKASPDVTIMLVGTKADASPGAREVDEAEAKALADEHGWIYFETSAMLGTHVRDAFYLLSCTVMNRLNEQDPKNVLNQEGKATLGGGGGGGDKAGGCC